MCGSLSDRVHSAYQRRLADLPWQSRIVEIRVRSRRFRCPIAECPRAIFTERLPEVVRPKGRRTLRMARAQLDIGLALGGEPGSRLVHRLDMPVSGDTLLRLIRTAPIDPPEPPRVIGVDEWAWQRGLRYGTIICDLERNCTIDLLPDRSADSLADWLRQHPGIEMVARDRAGVYADGARQGEHHRPSRWPIDGIYRAIWTTPCVPPPAVTAVPSASPPVPSRLRFRLRSHPASPPWRVRQKRPRRPAKSWRF
jgi:transposase